MGVRTRCSISRRVPDLDRPARAARLTPFSGQQLPPARPIEQPSLDCQHGAEGEEGEVPDQRCAEVIAHMVDAEDVMVDNLLSRSGAHLPGTWSTEARVGADRDGYQAN